MNLRSSILLVNLSIILLGTAAFSQRGIRSIVVQTEPNAIIWIDGVKHGVTNETGELKITQVKSGVRMLRVRADGFKEVSKKLFSRQKGNIRVKLFKTSDASILAFQKAEKLATSNKEEAIKLYKKAVKLRPQFAKAFIGLARVLTRIDYDEALATIARVRRIRPIYPEASAVEGRIYRSENEIDEAIDSFDRAIREGKGFQPEAHTGLGLIYKKKAESAEIAGDYEEEEFYYGEAAKSFGKAIEQLSATEPVLYFLLGRIYEQTGKNMKAIAIYKKFIRDFPTSNERSAAESFIVQIKKELEGDQ